MGKSALAGTGCAAIHNLQICDRFQDDFAEYVNCFGFSSPPPVAFLQVIFLSFPCHSQPLSCRASGALLPSPSPSGAAYDQLDHVGNLVEPGMGRIRGAAV
jgi:hypothetical protein